MPASVAFKDAKLNVEVVPPVPDPIGVQAKVGAGVPVATTLNELLLPTQPPLWVGWVVMTGLVLMVTFTVLLVTVPQVLVTSTV